MSGVFVMVKSPVGTGGIIPTIKPITGGVDGAPLTITHPGMMLKIPMIQ